MVHDFMDGCEPITCNAHEAHGTTIYDEWPTWYKKWWACIVILFDIPSTKGGDWVEENKKRTTMVAPLSVPW